MVTKAYGAHAADQPLEPIDIERRAPGPRDVQIDIAFCGVCHSDLHTVRAEWGGTLYPCVPGHEIVGHVSAVGDDVTQLQGRRHRGRRLPGRQLPALRFVRAKASSSTARTASPAPTTARRTDAPGHTLGGYSQRIVVDDKFVLKIRHPEDQLAAVAPLLCAGITTYSPLRHWSVGPGKKVGVVGIGGLGHMGVKIAHAMGAHVVAFTTSAGKRQDALDLGADEVVISRDADEMARARRQLRPHPRHGRGQPRSMRYSSCSSATARWCWSACPRHPHPSPNVGNLIFKRRAIAGSLIGGIPETQEMLDFCAEHGIVSDIEMIPVQQINEAYERMVKSDVKYRFVIDIASLAD